MEESLPSSPGLRGPGAFDRSDVKDERSAPDVHPPEIRGLEKFKQPHGNIDDGVGGLSRPSQVEVRGLEKFPTGSKDVKAETEADASEDKPEAVDIGSLTLTDSVVVETADGSYSLRFFGHGHFEVYDSDDQFVGDGKAATLAPGSQLEFTLSGRRHETSPITAIQHIPGV